MRLCSHAFTLLKQNKTGQSTQNVMFSRYACVHVLEEMKSLQHSCHDLAAMQISSTLRRRMRKRKKRAGWVPDLIQHELKLGWNEPTLRCTFWSQKDKTNKKKSQITADKSHTFHNLETL